VPTTETIGLLNTGRAFADLSSWRKVAVSGGDAFDWLNDLVSADISDLGPNRARRSLLLSPTGRIRAEFTVAVPGGNLLLVQDPTQPRSVLDLLSPYVLSSDVELEDRTNALALFAFPGRSVPPDIPGTLISAPSCLGPGVDLLAPAEDLERLRAGLAKSHRLAGDEEVEEWRVLAGIPRFGVDATEDDLPQESGFEDAVSYAKGCYLGQEAVARVRNLGHPRRLTLALDADGPVSPGDRVMVGATEAGAVTSAAGQDGGIPGGRAVLARIRWDAREGPFATARGTALRPRWA
jgi:folate-binding protein YgfZ